MSAFVPPQGGGSTMPAQGATRSGKTGRKRKTASAGFADALLSLVPQRKGSGSGARSATVIQEISPLEKRSEKEIRRKERIGKTSPLSKKEATVSDESAAAPALVASGIPAASVAASVIVSGSDRAPSSKGISANPVPANASTRSRERSQPSPQGVPEVSRRAGLPSGPQAKRSDGNPVNQQIAAGHDASIPEKGAVLPPLSPESDRPAVGVRTDSPRQKKTPMETSRENVAPAYIIPRSAPPDPGRTESRNGETVPNGFAPAADSSHKPDSGKTGTGREELPRKESGPAFAGTEPAAHPEGKGGSLSAVVSPRGATELRSGAPERGDAQLAEAGDPAKGRAFSGLLAVVSGVDPGTQGTGAPSSPTPGTSPREAPPSTPLFEQVAMKMTPLPDGAHDVEIRLTPEHLGKLKIELHIDSGRMDAFVQADNSEARALLLREEPALREALRNAGVTLSSFNVALSGEPWGERKGAARPHGDADSTPRRGRKEETLGGVTSVHGEEIEHDGMKRTEHWIA